MCHVSVIRIALAAAVSLLAGPALAWQGSAPAGGEDAAAKEIAALKAMVEKLQARVDVLEARLDARPAPAPPLPAVAPPQPAPVAATAAQPAAPASSPATDFNILRGTTVNFVFDGYYGYNFNDPIGRVNLLRAYDVSSNAFSLNQADVVLENAPDPEHGKRFGLRLDLQYGQATATLQGNAANEPRPSVYRDIFQAYGTYVAPIGGGLTIDFGKWASSLGMEGNYTKDQINYSRSLWFDFLPFYHMGARVNYKVNDKLSLNYWITNGTQQTEPFNGFKDQMFGLYLQPNKNLSWTINYYLGQEHPDFQYLPGATQPGLPAEQGIPFLPIVNPPNGKLHIFDTYAAWNATPKLRLAAEADDVIERLLTTSPPSRTWGGAIYARYQFAPRWAIGGRTEYLSDNGGLFTGVTQAVKEATLTLEQKIFDGFLMREEWRRDFSNHPYFLTDTLGILARNQTTATLGVVWWFGAKQGAW